VAQGGRVGPKELASGDRTALGDKLGAGAMNVQCRKASLGHPKKGQDKGD
jgi:hypothetical protein